MAGQDFSHQNPYNMGISPGPNTGNMIIDTGANIVRNYAWNRAGGQGPVQYLPPNQPGMNPLFQAAYLNQISPRQQELRNAYLSAFNPTGNYAKSALKNWGYKDESAALEEAMKDGSVGQVLAQMANQNPAVAKHMLGGDVFGSYDRMLANAGAFNSGNIRNASDFTKSADAALTHAHQLAGKLTERMYKDKKTGQFSPVPNADQTGGFAPDQAMDILNLMAQQGVYADVREGEGTRRIQMGSTNNKDIDDKMKMHQSVMQTLAKVARTTGANNAEQAFRDMQAYAGPGGMKNVTTMRQVGEEMTNMRAMSMLANNQNMQPSYLMNTAMETQFAVTAEIGGGLRDSVYARRQGYKVSEDVASIVEKQQQIKGAPLSQSEVDAIRDRQIKRRRGKMHSTAHRAVMVAYNLAARHPEAAKYLKELEEASTPAEQKRVMEKMSVAGFGNKNTLFDTANNEVVMSDFIAETEDIVGARPGGQEFLKNMYDKMDVTSERGEQEERRNRAAQLDAGSKIKSLGRVMRDSGKKMDADKLAKARGEAIINALEKTGEFSAAQIDDLKDTFGKGTARDLKSLKQHIRNSPDMQKHSDMLKTEEMSGAVNAYMKEVGEIDPKTAYPRDFQKQQRNRLRSMMRSSNRTEEQKQGLKEKLREIDKLPPSERGKAMNDFIQSDEFIALGGTKSRQESEAKRLETARKDLDIQKKGAGIIVDQGGGAEAGGVIADPAQTMRVLGDRHMRRSQAETLEISNARNEKYGEGGFTERVAGARDSLTKADQKAQKQASYAQRMLKLVQSGEQSMTDAEALMEASGMDPSVLKQMQADATKKDVEKGRKETNAANTMNEVVIKDGTKLIIIENGQQRTAKVVQ